MVTVVKEVPTKTPEEILQHEQWYVEYFTLLERKKKAIEEWREQKKVRHSLAFNRHSVLFSPRLSCDIYIYIGKIYH